MAGTARASRQPNQRLQQTGARYIRRPPHGFRLTATASCDLLAGTPAAEALVVGRQRESPDEQRRRRRGAPIPDLADAATAWRRRASGWLDGRDLRARRTSA